MMMVIAALLVIAALGYIRFAPAGPAKWHIPLAFSAADNPRGGARRLVPDVPGRLEALLAIATRDPHTTMYAGAAQTGHVTLVSRSPVFGFPDYTTIQRRGENLLIFGRLRFGRRDFRVNSRRIDAWIAALQQRPPTGSWRQHHENRIMTTGSLSTPRATSAH